MNTQYTEHDLLMDYLRYSERIPDFLWGADLKQMPTAAQLTADPRLAYKYAFYVIGKPWPPGEAAISQDAGWAYVYAFYVIRGPWPLGQPVQ